MLNIYRYPLVVKVWRSFADYLTCLQFFKIRTIICNKLSGESKTLAESSMKNAAKNLIKHKMENDPNDINLDGTVIAKVAVSVDGTWQNVAIPQSMVLC